MKGTFGRLFLAFPSLLFVWSIFNLASRSGLQHAIKPLLILAGLIGFLVWREWKVRRDPDFAAVQARRDGSRWHKARRAALIYIIVFAGAVFVLSLADALLHLGLKPPPEAFYTMLYAFFFGIPLVALLRFLWN